MHKKVITPKDSEFISDPTQLGGGDKLYTIFFNNHETVTFRIKNEKC